MRLPIATYGRRDCFITVLALLVASVLIGIGASAFQVPWVAFLSFVPAALAAFVTSFYRDFERAIPQDAGIVVSPADGTVTDVVEIEEKEFLKGPAQRIGIFLSPLNVHVNRSPLAATVETVIKKPGKMLKAYDPRCIEENEAVLLGLRTDGGLRIGVRQVTGALARRIVCAVAPGARLERGERYGMIKLGSRTELLVPKGAGFECLVKVGDAVRGGITVLGKLPAGATASVPATQEARS